MEHMFLHTWKGKSVLHPNTTSRTYTLPSDVEFLPLELGEYLKELLQEPYELHRNIFLILMIGCVGQTDAERQKEDMIDILGRLGPPD
jgi:hypothetical protein